MNSFMASIKTKSPLKLKASTPLKADSKKGFISKNSKIKNLNNNFYTTDKNKINTPLNVKLNAHLNSIQDVEFPQEE